MLMKPNLFSDKNNKQYEIIHVAYDYESREEYIVFRNAENIEKVLIATSKKFLKR